MLTVVRRGGQTREASSFLSLPAELRNQIYEYVLYGWVVAIKPSHRRHDSLEADIYPVAACTSRIPREKAIRQPDKPLHLLGILSTCRQVHAETRLLPYSLSTFFCGERPFPHAWLDILPEQLAQVRSLQLCSHIPANITLSRVWLGVLVHFTSLKQVDVFWQLRIPPFGQEEDHLATATRDEAEMKQKIVRATSTTCEVVFHRFVVSDWD